MRREVDSALNRRALEARAREISVHGQLERWPRDRVVNEILARLPDVTPLRAHRYAYGWTRQQLSQAIDSLYERGGLMAPQIAPSEICGWEHGRHLPSRERQDVLCRVYRTRPDRLGFGRDYSSEPDEEEADMDRRTAIKLLGGVAVAGLPLSLLDSEHAAAALGKPRQVTPALLDGLRTVLDQLIARRHAVPPDALIGPARAHLDYLRTLLDGPAPPAVRRELGGLTAEAALFVGLTEFSAARADQARACYRFARELAEVFGHPVVGAHALMKESLLHSRLLFTTSPRDSETALAILGRAAATRASLPAPMRASLAAQRAEEHAHLRQTAAYHGALETAQRAVAEVTDHGRVDLLSGWTEPRLAAYEGSCLLLLGEPRAAAAALETALRDQGALSPTIGLMARVDLGAARVEQGEAAEGSRLIGAAYEEASVVGRTLVQRRARRALGRLERWRTDPAVRDMVGRVLAA